MQILLQKRLKSESKSGFVDPKSALSILNNLQKEDDPEAYEPEIVIQQKKKLESLERNNQENMLEFDIDKMLFDFEDEEYSGRDDIEIDDYRPPAFTFERYINKKQDKIKSKVDGQKNLDASNMSSVLRKKKKKVSKDAIVDQKLKEKIQN